MADHLSPDSLGRSVQPGEVHLMSSEIPGGIFRCYTDTGWTILDVSRGFLNLFGYTTEDIQRKFQNKFLEMIDPRDRAAVMESLLRQSGTGKRPSFGIPGQTLQWTNPLDFGAGPSDPSDW